MGISSELRSKIETDFAKERYTLLKMLEAEPKVNTIGKLDYEVYFDNPLYTIKLSEAEHKENSCIIVCKYYAKTVREFVYIVDNILVIINDKWDLILYKQVNEITKLKIINHMIVAYESNGKTYFINASNGKEELVIDKLCAIIYDNNDNWNSIETDYINISTCKDLSIISKTYYTKGDNDGNTAIVLKLLQNVTDIHLTKTSLEKPCIYDMGFTHNSTRYFIKENKIYTFEELLNSLDIQIVETIVIDNKIDRYTVKSSSGMLGEMTSDFTQIKIGNKYIRGDRWWSRYDI